MIVLSFYSFLKTSPHCSTLYYISLKYLIQVNFLIEGYYIKIKCCDGDKRGGFSSNSQKLNIVTVNIVPSNASPSPRRIGLHSFCILFRHHNSKHERNTQQAPPHLATNMPMPLFHTRLYSPAGTPTLATVYILQYWLI